MLGSVFRSVQVCANLGQELQDFRHRSSVFAFQLVDRRQPRLHFLQPRWICFQCSKIVPQFSRGLVDGDFGGLQQIRQASQILIETAKVLQTFQCGPYQGVSRIGIIVESGVR